MNGDLLHGLEQKKIGEIWSDFFSSNTHSNLTWRDPFASLFLILTGFLSLFKTFFKQIKP
jgi:hypothetical protein